MTLISAATAMCAAAAAIGSTPGKTPAQPASEPTTVLNFTMKNIDGQDVDLGKYRGHVLLLVNVASYCGYTPQYKDLQKLQDTYGERGLRILAFPANNFGGQEPDPNDKIKQFCISRFNVTFDLFAKVSVAGDDQCPLYKFLTDKKHSGKFGGDIRWNFTKFLIDRHGQIVARFEPGDNPMSDKVVQAIETALAEPQPADTASDPKRN